VTSRQRGWRIAWVIAAVLSVAAHAPADAGHGAPLRIGMRGQRFFPARIVATVDDTLRFELESGGPHNIAFDPDSIPPGALARLARNMRSDPRYLVTPEMLIDPGETFSLPLAGLPPGTYRFYCTPHLGGGMRGELVVTR
jgi:plastocyanin